MHVGAQIPYSPENLQFLRQMGVRHVDCTPHTGLGLEDGGYWRTDLLCRLREDVESYGLELEALHLPLTAAGIEKQIWPNIMLGRPERDRDIVPIGRPPADYTGCARSRRTRRRGDRPLTLAPRFATMAAAPTEQSSLAYEAAQR